MLASRNPHPHLDPRQPRDQAVISTNPPVFAWKAKSEQGPFRLRVANGAGTAILAVDGLRDPVHLPVEVLAPGSYTWHWEDRQDTGETFAFTVPEDAVELSVSPVSEWLSCFGTDHPRLYLSTNRRDQIRAALNDEYADAWSRLQPEAEELLADPRHIEEPPYLPNRSLDYLAFAGAFGKAMWESRAFVANSQALGLAYLLSGDRRYARAACERMTSICRWDPMGSTHLAHNDEPHMSVIWHGPTTCDWIFDEFTDGEREIVISQYRRRGQITFEHMHGRGCYGITRFDSHAGREIVFLAMTALAFHEHIPEAEEWLEWLRPVLCGIWPVWSGDDGAWAEGLSYGLAYVNIMTMFATALKHGAGIDLFRRPFWQGHARWRQACFPPYAEWIGFGDHSERWATTWIANADLVELIGRETGTSEFTEYVRQLRDAATECPQRIDSGFAYVNPLPILLPGDPGTGNPATAARTLRVFPTAGWGAFRTQPEQADQDIAMIVRSSPFGSISHSHANQNDFILHAGGTILAMPSGYYDGYGSPHHANWVWHTKSHNCLTLSDAGQLMRSHAAAGALEAAYEDDALAYVRGTADAAYADRAERCRRHFLFLKAHRCFLLVDEFEAKPGIVSTPQWNLHSWAQFATDAEARTFSCERKGAALDGAVMFHRVGFFTQTEGWQPPPRQSPRASQWHNQHHLRFSPSGFAGRLTLGVLLCPSTDSLPPCPVQTALIDGVETAELGEDRVYLSSYHGVDCPAGKSEGLGILILGGTRYDLLPDGITRVG